MPEIICGKSASSRERGSLPELPVINMFAEAAPTEKGSVTMQSRRGLLSSTTLGSGPIRVIRARDGVLAGVQVVVSGTSVYVAGALVGTLAGSGPVSIAGNATQVLIAAGGAMARWDGTTFSTVTFPDGANVTAVTYAGSRFLAVRENSHRVYFSDLLDGSAWDGLDYFSAETSPDYLVDALVVNDVLVLVGASSIEHWISSGPSTAPYTRIEQRLFSVGAKATGCCIEADNTMYFIGSDNIFYRAENVPAAISDDGLTALIGDSSAHSLFKIEDEKHKFVCIRLDDSTHAHDVTTKLPCEFKSHGRSNFRVQCADGAYLGDDEDGTLWVFSAYEDNAGPLERRIRGGFPLDGGSVTIDNVRIRADVGHTSYLTGDYENPSVEMRFSNDYGNTWSDWDEEPLGAQGDYRTMPEWRALGMADYPGVLFEWRVTDPVGFRFSGATINELGGGRQR